MDADAWRLVSDRLVLCDYARLRSVSRDTRDALGRVVETEAGRRIAVHTIGVWDGSEQNVHLLVNGIRLVRFFFHLDHLVLESIEMNGCLVPLEFFFRTHPDLCVSTCGSLTQWAKNRRGWSKARILEDLSRLVC